MSRLTVKPQPVSTLTANRSRHAMSAGSRASRDRTARTAPPKTPIVLPTTRPATTAHATRSSTNARRPRAKRYAGGEEREQRHADPGGERLQPVFQHLGRRVALAGVGAYPGEQADRDAGDGGVHAATRAPAPRRPAPAHVEPPAADAHLLQQAVEPEHGDRAEQRQHPCAR